MLIKNLPLSLINKTFLDIKELLDYIYKEQIITEMWELSEYEVNTEMKEKFLKAKKISRDKFINI